MFNFNLVSESHSGYNFFGTPEEFIKKVKDLVDSHVPKNATNVHIGIETEPDYDGDQAVLTLSYYIPKTKQDIAKEKEEAERSKELRKKQYESLRKEFEGGN
jgi:hypothetical protein